MAGAAFPALAWSGTTHAQARPPLVIGWLHSSSHASENHGLNAFNEGMAAFGWKHGTQYVVEERWADGRRERLPALALELAAKKPAVIVANSATSGRHAGEAAPATPVVLSSGDPLWTGLVKSLARPGGMITGVSNISFEMNEKLFELLVESLPQVRRVGFLADASGDTYGKVASAARQSAQRYRVDLILGELKTPEEIEPVIARLAQEKAQALLVSPSLWFATYRQQIMKLALAQRWPIVAGSSGYAEQGALFSYGADRTALYQRSAYFVDRILKGAKPSDLPIEQPTKFEMVINMKTAKALGITIPQTILVRANRVIE